MGKLPSPCIDICKYKLRGHCIACSMTKPQKSLFKQLDKDKHKEAFVLMLISQQQRVGSSKGWLEEYQRRCAKHKVDFALGVLSEMSRQ